METQGRPKRLQLLLAGIFLILGSLLIRQGLKSDNQQQKETQSQDITQEATPSAVNIAGIEGQKVKVSQVIDGDTIELEDGRKVRYIGIDTPETLDPRRLVGCFGKEASNENKRLVEEKEVYLVKDVSETDKYGRLLRYVYLPLPNDQLLFVNDFLVREGFAKASTFPPDVRFTQQFLEAERDAREKRRGLWEKCI